MGGGRYEMDDSIDSDRRKHIRYTYILNNPHKKIIQKCNSGYEINPLKIPPTPFKNPSTSPKPL